MSAVPRYRFAQGLWVITAYYNPVGYRTRRKNYEAFAGELARSGIPLLTVECAFDDQPFDLPVSMEVVRVRSRSILWQKERLLNLAISWLPRVCESVAWLDCDLLFTNPDWAVETVALLQAVPLVQVFRTCNRLTKEGTVRAGSADICQSFGSVVGRDPSVLHGGTFERHGHTGYGWAARRSLLDRHGLYEYAVAGSADHFMAHAATGDLDSPCIERMQLRNPLLRQHYREWAAPFHESVRGAVAATSGEILHLWHGEAEDRKYSLRHVELADLGYNPYTDLIAPPGKPFELKEGKPTLAEWFRNYFPLRQEDGAALSAG